jgi:outer membrane lipoprotein-sorting protein
MKRLMTFLSAIVFVVVAFAQTPEEIIAKMEAELDKHEAEGIIMTIDMKIPIIGTMTTKAYTLGDKMRVEGSMMGVSLVTWTDGVTEWTWDSKKNEIEIKKEDPKKKTEEADAAMFSGITDGYDVTLKKETADAWYFLCKKSKTNTDKDDPKSMDLVVAKGTYYPVSLKAKLSGVTMTLRDVSFGVTEQQVTFNPKDYPTATIVDKR